MGKNSLEANEDHGKLILAKRNTRDAIDELYGMLKLGRRTDEIIDQIRGGDKPE